MDARPSVSVVVEVTEADHASSDSQHGEQGPGSAPPCARTPKSLLMGSIMDESAPSQSEQVTVSSRLCSERRRDVMESRHNVVSRDIPETCQR